MPASLDPPHPLRKRKSTVAAREAADHRKKAKDATASTKDTTTNTTTDTTTDATMVRGVNSETVTADEDCLDIDALLVKLKIKREARSTENLEERRPRMRPHRQCCSCKHLVKVSTRGNCAECGHERCAVCLHESN
jgi:rRNA maturation endonuclease Nob1